MQLGDFRGRERSCPTVGGAYLSGRTWWVLEALGAPCPRQGEKKSLVPGGSNCSGFPGALERGVGTEMSAAATAPNLNLPLLKGCERRLLRNQTLGPSSSQMLLQRLQTGRFEMRCCSVTCLLGVCGVFTDLKVCKISCIFTLPSGGPQSHSWCRLRLGECASGLHNPPHRSIGLFAV